MDGKFATLTRGVVLMFQSDNGLKTDGIVGDKSWTALELAMPRPIGESRAEASVADLRDKGSRTIAKADALQVGGVVVGGVGLLDTATGYVDQLDTASGLVGRAADALEPLAATLTPLMGFMTAHWPVLALGMGAYVIYAARGLKKIRLLDHRTGKNGGR